MRKVIINGDDLGLSIGTNEGICACLQEGILSSTSIMAGGGALMTRCSAYSDLDSATWAFT